MSTITETRIGECGFLIYFTRDNGTPESAFVSHACWDTALDSLFLTPEDQRQDRSCFGAQVGTRWVMAMNLCEIVAYIESL